MRAVASLCGLLLLAGCANLTVLEPPRVEETTSNFPEVGTTASAAVGDVMVSQAQYWRKTGMRLSEASNTRIGGGEVQVQPGDFLTKAIVDGVQAYCTERPAFRMIGGGGKTACFVDQKGNGRFDQVKVASEVNWWSATLETPVGYGAGELIVPRPDSKKSELVYQGFSKDVLRLAYREYVGDMARPAFFQDLTYEVTSFPADIRFKQIQLKILAAGNNGIQYQVTSAAPVR